MDQRYVLAYDLGTSGVKGALVNMQGEVIDTATADYLLYTPNPNWAEQDPEQYWQGVCEVTRQVLEHTGVAPDTVAGMAFGTQWKGIIPIDKDGKVLHNSIIWLDARAVDQAKRLNEKFGEGMFAASDYWPKLMWLRENRPECVENAEIILEDDGSTSPFQAMLDTCPRVGKCSCDCISIRGRQERKDTHRTDS